MKGVGKSVKKGGKVLTLVRSPGETGVLKPSVITSPETSVDTEDQSLDRTLPPAEQGQNETHSKTTSWPQSCGGFKLLLRDVKDAVSR